MVGKTMKTSGWTVEPWKKCSFIKNGGFTSTHCGLIMEKNGKHVTWWYTYPSEKMMEWVRQLGWWNSQYMEKFTIHVPNHQPVFEDITNKYLRDFEAKFWEIFIGWRAKFLWTIIPTKRAKSPQDFVGHGARFPGSPVPSLGEPLCLMRFCSMVKSPSSSQRSMKISDV